MPLPKNISYRVKTTSSGKKVRLAFNDGKVIEAKNLKSGETHTPSEFANDRKRKAKKIDLILHDTLVLVRETQVRLTIPRNP